MTAQLELEVYRHLVAYLDGKEPLQQFRHWFDLNTWDQGQSESVLVGQIELVLAEFSSLGLSESEFRKTLQSSIPTLTLELLPMVPPSTTVRLTSASNNTSKLISGFVAQRDSDSGQPAENSPNRTFVNSFLTFQPQT